jgi:DHA2 family multidrug resistance protein
MTAAAGVPDIRHRSAPQPTAPVVAPALAAPIAPAPAEKFDRRKLAAFMFMVFGMFMAILDIQIVSASLSQIQAGLSASQDEVTWVQTAYLVAEVIMIPLSGFLSRMLSTRIVFTISAAGFTLMSLMCSTATSIDEMIVWRALQGFIGGGMIPTVFASAFIIFPRSKQPIIGPVIGLVATLAPTIGPTVGGYLTDWFSWHWLFLVNIPPGVIVTLAAWFLIDFDKGDIKLFDKFDWTGLAAMAGFLGALEYALEEGPSKDWFESTPVTLAIIVSIASSVAFFWRAFTAPQPIVDLTTFANRNFWAGCLLSFIMGIGLYGLTYIYPVYLAAVRGFTPLMIGKTMFVTGAVMFITAPISGRLITKVDGRAMIAFGFLCFAAGTYMASQVTVDWDFNELLIPQILRGAGLMLCMVPINNLTLGTMAPNKIKNASGLFNLTRNLGGAVGLALINTLLDKRWDLHLQRLRDSIVWGRETAESTINNLAAGMAARGSDAVLAATKEVAMMVRKQAMVLALADVFLALTVLFVLTSALSMLMRKPQMMGGGGGGH